jgi:hypothetical protein
MKLLSPHGELLNVINCFGGQITVFRAHSQADLRPYQRALCGTQGPERFAISVDNTEYRPQDHSLVGFGERLPQDGVTVAEYLQGFNVPEMSVDSLLLSYGLEGYGAKLCAELTADEQRRVQLLAAIHRPDRVLIMNEPFEPIVGSWRERFAELLTSFVRQRKAIVLVTALSYRPECWIDNESVARVQVGEAIQKTVGFAGGTSQAADLVRQIREDQLNAASTPSPASPPSSAKTSDLLGTPASTPNAPLPDWGASKETTSAQPLVSRPTDHRLGAPRAKLAAGALLGLCVLAIGGWWFGRGGELPAGPAPNPAAEEMLRVAAQRENPPEAPNVGVTVQPSLPVEPPRIEVPRQPPAQPQLVLDEYPEFIRASLLDTVNGVVSDLTTGGGVVPAVEQKPSGPSNGNIFKLLESASNKAPERPSTNPPVYVDGPPPPVAFEGGEAVPYVPPPPLDEETELAKREAIRQKFLEAIRAAAERRAAGEGQ